MGKYLRISAGLAITILFLWLAFRNVNLSELEEALGHADYAFLLPAALCSTVAFCLRTVRWGLILAPVRRIPVQRLFPVLMVGFAANNVLPARVGEVVRAYILGSRERVSRSMALATIVVERVFDGLTLIALMVATFLFAPLPIHDQRLRIVAISAIAIFGAATLALAALALFPAQFVGLMRAILRHAPKRFAERATALLETSLQGLLAVRHPGTLAKIAGLSLVIWLLECSSFAFVLRAFPLGLGPRAWLAAALFLLVFVNLGIMIPSAPGYIGTYQFFATLALAAFNVAPASALGLAIVAHATQYVLITGIGFICLSSLGLTPVSLRRLTPAVSPVRANEPDAGA